MPQLTQSEQEAMMLAMANSFGPCTCQPNRACDGHRFLGEVQRWNGQLTDRVSVLAHYRRMARLWTDSEHSRRVEPELPPNLIPESREEPDHPNRLPW